MQNDVFEPGYWDENNRHYYANLAPDQPFVALKLRCGVVEIREGTGRDAQKASRLSGGDPDKVMPALMHLLCTVNGSQLPADDFLDLKLSDFSSIQTVLNEIVAGGN